MKLVAVFNYHKTQKAIKEEQFLRESRVGNEALEGSSSCRGRRSAPYELPKARRGRPPSKARRGRPSSK